MRTKFIAAILVMTVTPTIAFAQAPAAPKATKAEVQKLVDSIKSDKAKLAQFCEMTKLSTQAGAMAQKNPNDPKLDELGKQMDAIAAKLGPDYEKVTNSELDDASAAPFDELSKGCN
jgi:hypothetical protein